MPVLKISKKDIDRSKPPSDGWHKFRVEAFSDSESKDKQSKNMVFDLVCLESGENENRYAFARFNSKAMGMMIPFLAAVLDRTIDEEIEFDPEQLFGKEVFGNVKTEIYEGKPQKKTEEFAPVSAPPF